MDEHRDFRAAGSAVGMGAVSDKDPGESTPVSRPPFVREWKRELDEVVRVNAIIEEALRAITDPHPDDVTDEWLNGPKTFLFAVHPGDKPWLPVGEYLLQIYADGTVTLAWREKVGEGTWGVPLSGSKA